MQTIKFSRVGFFTGRNGTFKQAGIKAVEIQDDKIMLLAITGREQIGNCMLTIPKENIPAFISALTDLLPKPPADDIPEKDRRYQIPGHQVNMMYIINDVDIMDHELESISSLVVGEEYIPENDETTPIKRIK